MISSTIDHGRCVVSLFVRLSLTLKLDDEKKSGFYTNSTTYLGTLSDCIVDREQ